MTEQQQRRRAVDAETRLQLLIESVRDYAIFMIDSDGLVETWNRGAAAIKGYQADEIIGRSIATFYTPEDRDAGLPQQLLAIARRDGRVESEGWRVRKDGTRFWSDVVITALLDDDGELVGFAKVTRDLTDRRNAELERLRLAHAHEAVRLRDDFLSIASHELRTPLMALQLQIESAMLIAEGGNPKISTKLERADRSVRRLTELVDTLLDVARIATGKLEIVPRTLDLADIATDVIDRMQDSAVEAGCTLTSTIEPGVIGNWDPLRIGQMLTNLLANAYKYAAGTPVELALETTQDSAVLCVTDRGPGVDPEQLTRIFGRFERAADARHYGGLGLGLYVSHEIAKAHGGTIHAHNRPGGGAAFEIRLPRGGA